MKSIKQFIIALGLTLLLAIPGFAAEKTCCEKAKAGGKPCPHKCCITAKKQNKTCEKCNPKPKDATKKAETQDK